MLRAALLGTAVTCLTGAALSFSSYRADCRVIRAKALDIVNDHQAPDARVLALTTWVHRHLGTSQNPERFLFKRLRATPRQVLEGGGDCADKSRLLASMLRQIGLPATMAMCFHPETGSPTHTLVETRLGPNDYMVVDPAFELHYPRPDGSGYFGILALRNDPQRLVRRVEHVQATTPRFRPLHWYDPVEAGAAGMSTFNWNKDGATRLARDVLFLALGPHVYRLPRPAVLEEPKVAVATGLLIAALAALTVRSAIRRFRMPRRHHTARLLGAGESRRKPAIQRATAGAPPSVGWGRPAATPYGDELPDTPGDRSRVRAES